MALPIVYDGVREPVVDLVSIPGLPDLHPQYKVKDHNSWLGDVLSRQIPSARIMSYQYNFGETPSNVDWKDLTEQVLRLLFAIIHRRERECEINRPIVFICYSFGAFILKKALLTCTQQREFIPIIDCTAGIVFLGCLHNERHPDFQDACLRCAAVELKLTAKKSPALELLKASNSWSILKEVMQSFKEISATFPVKSYYELRKTVYKSSSWSYAKSSCLCSENLSTLGWDNEDLIGVDVDHSKLSTFPNRSEPFFDTFMENLAEMVNEIYPATADDALSILTPAQKVKAASVRNWAQLVEASASVASFQTSTHFGQSGPTSASIDPFALVQPVRELKLPCFVTTPHQRNLDFVGREDVLRQIHDALAHTSRSPVKQRSFALCGLGGMGKTQIAVEYVFSHRDDFTVILWAHADSRSKLIESYSRFTVELGLSESEGSDRNAEKEKLKAWLENTDESWLLVMDNADSEDNRDLLAEFLPTTTRGSLLVTSRDKNLISQFEGLELEKMDEDAAVRLLKSMTNFKQSRLTPEILQNETAAAAKIVKQIGYLPLGIRQAANIIVSDASRLTDFLNAYNNRELIQDSQEISLIRQSSTPYTYSLRTVWNMNFERLSSEHQSLLNVMAFLDPDRIQQRLFKDRELEGSEPVLDVIATPNKFYKCKVALLKSSLVSQNEELQELEMHRLVQAACHLRMDHESRRNNFRLAVALMRQNWPVPPRNQTHNPPLWAEQQAFLPHVQSLCEYYVDSCRNKNPLLPQDAVEWNFPSLLYEAAWFCYERGLLESVSALAKPAERYCLDHMSHEGGEVILADLYGVLGSLDTETNQFQGCHDNFSKQWTYIQKAFETGRLQKPSIWEVFGLGRLGNGLQALHRYTEAEERYRQCLEVWKNVPGDQRIFTTHLATCLWLQGRLDEAEETVTKLLVDKTDITNFRTGLALFSLGNIQIAQAEQMLTTAKADEAEKKYEEAFETHSHALHNWQAVLGPTHHKTADAFHKIGWHYHRQRDCDKAMAKLNQALAIYKTNTKFFKNEIARTMFKIGCVYQDLGSLALGRAAIEEAQALRKEIMPAEKWSPATDEKDFDEIVMYWTR